MKNRELPEELVAHLEMLSKEKAADKKALAEKGPQVAVFYIINDKIYGHGDDLTSAKVESSMLWPRINHISWWENMSELLPGEASTKSSSYYPRGRVIYSTHQETFYVVLDHCINTPEWIEKLKKKYNLQDQKVGVYEEPSHYYCHMCR